MNSLTPLDKYSDGEPVEKLKTNYKDPKKRYELAERMIWAKLADWQKQVIIKCRVEGGNDRTFDEYVREIAVLAENEKAILSEDYPPVPHISVEQTPLTK